MKRREVVSSVMVCIKDGGTVTGTKDSAIKGGEDPIIPQEVPPYVFDSMEMK